MKYSSEINWSFKSKLLDVIRGNIELVPSLQSSFIRHCNITSMTIEERYLLYFSIVNQSSNAVVITDDRKRIIYVNKEFERISGYNSGEVLGMNPKILASGNTPYQTYQKMNESLAHKIKWKGEFINKRPDGSEYVEEVVITPILNNHGDAICYLGEKKDVTAQREAESIVRRLTYFDNLTQVYNRSYFVEKLEKMTTSESSPHIPFSVLFVDLNRFKKINDIYGHLAGDEALIIIAKRLESITSSYDFVARVGGDEFVIVHINATPESTQQLAMKVTHSFDSPLMIDDREHYLGASIGSAVWPNDGELITDILSRADLAMYNAKTVGHCYSRYTQDIGLRYTREFELSRKLELAVQDNLLSLVYQPKVDLLSGEIDGVEALLRWNDSEFGNISPSEFIPVAEKYKLMNKLGDWVYNTVCKQISIWKKNGLNYIGRVAINISVQQIEHQNFFDHITTAFQKLDVTPHDIELEVTESLLITDPHKLMHLLKDLHSVGFSISIDDFGTGYSSLAYLNKLDVDKLKIDRSFIKRLKPDTSELSIIKSMIELGHNLGLTVIAEGVETKEQLKCLVKLGCDVAQGFLFYRPVPAHDLIPHYRWGTKFQPIQIASLIN